MEKLRHDEAHTIKSYKERVHAWQKNTSYEQLTNYSIITCALTYCVGYIFVESVDDDEIFRKNRTLSEGWSFLGRRKDIADFEWTFWVSDLRVSLIKSLISHVFIGIVSRTILPEAQKVLQSFFCAYCISTLLGYPFVIIVALQSLTNVAIVNVSKSRWICWATMILQLIFLHYDANYTQFIANPDSAMAMVAYSALAFSVIRTTGYCLDVISFDKQPINMLHDVITYNFYLPFFLFGPVMTFDAFQCKQSTFDVEELKHMLKEILTTIISIALIDYLLHFLHVSSIPFDLESNGNYPGIIITFLLFCNVMLDWIKAWALYSISSGIASHVDGYQGAPHAPKCMGNLYTFADTYFDRGIHHWACKYIYDPTGLNHELVKLETLAGGLTFAFVALWQGGGTTVFIWAFLNWAGLSFEFAAIKLAEQNGLTDKYTCILFGTTNYLMILLFNCVAIIGLEPTTNFARKLLLEDTVGCLLSLFVLFCYVSAIYNHKEMDRKNTKKIS